MNTKEKKKTISSKMMDELTQLKVYGGREEAAAKFKLSMKNCKTICTPTKVED